MECLSEMLIIAVTMSTFNAYTLFQKQADTFCSTWITTVLSLIKLKQLVQVFNEKPCTHHMALHISTPCTVSLHIFLQLVQEHKVTQFQMSCWTAEGLCTSPPAIMAVIEQVLVIQRRTGNKPIVVHGRWASWLEPFFVIYMCMLHVTQWVIVY